MSKIPKQLTIKGAHWHVVITRTLKYGKDKSEILGLCDPSVRCIYINKKQSHRQQWITFCHEVIHALEHEYEVILGHKIIGKLEGPMADLIINNFFAI